MKRVYRLAVYEIVNFDKIETLEEGEFELVEVIEGSSQDECYERAIAVYDVDRFVWWTHDF